MALLPLLSVLTQPELNVDTPSWAPIVFAIGAFAVVVLVLILVWQKLKQTQMRNNDPEDPDTRDQDQG